MDDAVRPYRHGSGRTSSHRQRTSRLAMLALVLALLAPTPAPTLAAPTAGPADDRPRPEAIAIRNDVVVYGATPSGIVAAIAASRDGSDVTLVEPTEHIGGMMTSGLSWTDRGDVGVIGGIAREVFDRIQAIEGTAYGKYAFAPSTAERVFSDLLDAANVDVVLGQRLDEGPGAVSKAGSRITMFRTESGDTFAADVFVDATYEADLMAAAGVAYRVGRESTAEFDETLAGVRPARFVMTVPGNVDPGFPLVTPGPLGSADGGIQSSNYRVCLSTDPTNQTPFPRPDDYDPDRYDIVATYIQQRVAAGLTPSKSWVLHVDRLNGDKWDLNQNGPITFGMPGHNHAYPDASYAEREAIENEQRSYQQGFLYFLANDERVPTQIRADMNDHGLCADEFTDSGNWPPRMYLRVGRRMEGRTMVTQHDIDALVSKPDTIGLASYPLDVHAVSRWMSSGRRLHIEGSLVPPRQQRWSIPYRSITPVESQASNLLVSVAASASHVVFSSLRVEPQYMIMGQAAGTAAALARDLRVSVQRVPVGVLQDRLRSEGAVLTDPGDLADSPFYTAVAWAYHQGITGGCAPRRFCPDSRLRRDEMASLLSRTLSLPFAPTDYFVDDDANMHEGNINRVARARITLGCEADRYCPTRTVTRQEMASFLVRALGLPRTSRDFFVDDEDSVHEADINRLAASGITAGCSATHFCAEEPVTRGQVMAFLYRAYDGGSIQASAIGATASQRSSDAPAEPAPSPTPSEAPSATPEASAAPSTAPSPSATPGLSTPPESTVEPSPSPTPAPSEPPSGEPTPTPSPDASGTPP